MVLPMSVAGAVTGAREVSDPVQHEFEYSVCTIVNDRSHYQAMLASFRNAGFDENTSEFLYIDNVDTNRFDAFDSVNQLIAQSSGKYIVLCHQDVRLLSDGIDALTNRLDALNTLDESWALAGNAGKTPAGERRIRITDRHGANQHNGPLPTQVVSLDENFMVVKQSAMLGVSTDLGGYHLYGTDICLLARMRGLNAYVIDFHLEHLGAGKIKDDFFICADDFERKYQQQFKRRLLKTLSTRLMVGAMRWELGLRAWLRRRRQS